MGLIRGLEALSNAQITLINTARRELAVRVCKLDSLPQDDAFTDALVQLIKRYPQSRVRILYNEVGQALEMGHLIIGLRRRLPSSVFLRQCDDRDAGEARQWWVADRFGLLLQTDANRAEASFDEFAKAAGPQHLDLFEEAWQRSREDVRLREVLL